MFSFALQVVIAILFIGGAIAYIGNYIGRLIGKKRLTIFNLRPRYTATAITIISGVLIAVSTLGFLLAVSQDARTALLGLENLKGQIRGKALELEKANDTLAGLNRSLQESRTEIARLQRVREGLRREVEASRQGQVLFKVGEAITLSLIQAGPDKSKLEAGLKQVLSAADSYVRGLGVKGAEHLIYMAPSDFDQSVYALLNDNKIYVVKLTAARNVLWGEEIPVRFELAENRLIYKEGQAIADSDIPSAMSAPEIEQEIMKLLRASHQSAREEGVLPGPTGSVGSIPYSQIFDLAKKIKSFNRKVNLQVLAAKEIYVIGPLEVKFKISYK